MLDPVRGRTLARQPERVGQRDAEDARGAAAAHGRACSSPRSPTTCCRRSGRAASASTSTRSPTTRCRPRSSATACSAEMAARWPRLGGRPARAGARVRRVRSRELRAAFASRAGARRRQRRDRARASRRSSTPRSTAAAATVARPPTRGARGVRRRDGAARLLPIATRNACGAGSTNATSARRAGRASTCCSKASPRSRSVYRDALAAPAPPLNPDRPLLRVDPRAAAAALDACREAREAFLDQREGHRAPHLPLDVPAAEQFGPDCVTLLPSGSSDDRTFPGRESRMADEVGTFCPACGAAVEGENDYCTWCGLGLRGVQANELAAARPNR